MWWIETQEEEHPIPRMPAIPLECVLVGRQDAASITVPFLLHLFPRSMFFFFFSLRLLLALYVLVEPSQPASLACLTLRKRVAYPLGALLFSCCFALLSLLVLSAPVRVADLLEPCRCLPVRFCFYVVVALPALD